MASEKKVPEWFINDTRKQKTGATPNSGPGGGKSTRKAAGRSRRYWGEGSRNLGEAQALETSQLPRLRLGSGSANGGDKSLSWWSCSARCKRHRTGGGGWASEPEGPYPASNCSDLGRPGPTSDSQPQPEANVQFPRTLPGDPTLLKTLGPTVSIRRGWLSSSALV